MEKFEYKRFVNGDGEQLIKELNELGEQGWELLSISWEVKYWYAWLKRRKETV
jgi:hypothetical protein